MKIAITGSEGQLGSRLVSYGCEPLLCDVTNSEELYSELNRVCPDVIIHLAAKTNVEWCEAHETDAMTANIYGTSLLCQITSEVLGDGRVVVVSSDQAFDGQFGYYKEDDEPAPVNVYGLTKLSAEGVADLYDGKIIRISRCFDSKSKDILDYIGELQRGKNIAVPAHIIRSYCHLDFMAEAFWEYANRFSEMPKLLHLGSLFPVSFHELMLMIAEQFRLPKSLINPRGDVAGYIRRPGACGLDVSLAKSLGLPIYTVRQSVEKMKYERSY